MFGLVLVFPLAVQPPVSSPETSAPAPVPAPTAEPAPAPAPSPAAAEPEPEAVAESAPAPAEAKAEPETPEPRGADRVNLRDGGMLVGRIVAVQKGSHVTIVLAETTESRTVGWALIDAYQFSGKEEEIASRGRPSIAELAAESDSIERQMNIGLGLLYGGYVMGGVTLITWGGYAYAESTGHQPHTPWLVAAGLSTAVTIGCLVGGGVMALRARERRIELRKVQVGASWAPGGGTVALRGRF